MNINKMSNKPQLSVIIPMYNSAGTINQCISAIYNSSYKDYEVIVVDDASTDNSAEIVSKFPCKLIRLDKNLGPAYARNHGAKHAVGEILLFLDSDVVLEKSALEIAMNDLKMNKDSPAVVGIYSKTPANNTWFNWFMALQKFSNWTMSQEEEYTAFQTRLGAIRKDIFTDLGGYNPIYRKADTEDYEFGYRLTSKYGNVLLDKRIMGRHYFPSFPACVKRYFKRSFMWFRLFLKRRKFDNVTTTKSTGFFAISGLLSLISFVLLLLFSKVYISVKYTSHILGFAGVLFLAIFVVGNSHFYRLSAKEKGVLFMIYTILTSYLLAIIVTMGVIVSIFTYPLVKIAGIKK